MSLRLVHSTKPGNFEQMQEGGYILASEKDDSIWYQGGWIGQRLGCSFGEVDLDLLPHQLEYMAATSGSPEWRLYIYSEAGRWHKFIKCVLVPKWLRHSAFTDLFPLWVEGAKECELIPNIIDPSWQHKYADRYLQPRLKQHWHVALMTPKLPLEPPRLRQMPTFRVRPAAGRATAGAAAQAGEREEDGTGRVSTSGQAAAVEEPLAAITRLLEQLRVSRVARG